MPPLRTFAPALLLALLPATASLGEQEWLDSDMMSNSEQIYAALDEEDGPLRAARGTLDPRATGCLTPVEAVSTAYLAGPEGQTNGRFLLDVKGGGADPLTEPQRHFYLNSHPDFRRFGTLVLAFEPEVMRKLLNPPRTRPRKTKEGDIIVEARRRRVALTRDNMMKRFGGQRILVDGEFGLKWIAFIGTRGREGVPGEGYYQVWVRIASADQVTVLDDDKTS